MWNRGYATDIQFLVGEGDQQSLVEAHKYVLVSRSPVFFAMLCGNMSEAREEGPIRIPDVTPEAFRILLK